MAGLPSLVTGVRAAKDAARGLVLGENFQNRSYVGAEKIRHTGTPSYNAVRGLMAQRDDTDKVLIFQFNPEEVSDVKETQYETRSYTGYSANDYIWIGGGERKISFKLFLDATASSNTPHFKQSVAYGNPTYDTLIDKKPRGTLDDVEMLMGFLYPVPEDKRRPRFTSGGIVPNKQFSPPPVAVFALGEYYLEGYVMSVDTTHQLFNQDLVPVRSECNVVFAVLEADLVTVNESIRSKTRL